MLLGMLSGINGVGIGTMSYVAFLKMGLPIRPPSNLFCVAVLASSWSWRGAMVLLCSVAMIDGPGFKRNKFITVCSAGGHITMNAELMLIKYGLHFQCIH